MSADKTVKCGPENCPIMVWADLTPTERKTKRKAEAERLYQQGFTEEQIAKLFDVSQKTISQDLDGVYTKGINQPRPKGGRPKGTKSKRYPGDAEQRTAEMVLDQGKSLDEARAATGLPQWSASRAVAREEGRREAVPTIDPEMLSMTAQEKLDAAIRQYKHTLDREFQQRVSNEVVIALNEVTLPHYTKKLEQLERFISSRKGVMDKTTYNKIRWCLHSDHVQDPLMKRRYDEAFTIFNNLEKLLLSEKDSPTQFHRMPRTYDELMAARAKMQAGRKGKRATVMAR
jgi:transposase